MASSPRPLGSPNRGSSYGGSSPSRSFTGSTEFNRKALVASVQTPFDDVVNAEMPWNAKDIGRNAISVCRFHVLAPYMSWDCGFRRNIKPGAGSTSA